MLINKKLKKAKTHSELKKLAEKVKFVQDSGHLYTTSAKGEPQWVAPLHGKDGVMTKIKQMSAEIKQKTGSSDYKYYEDSVTKDIHELAGLDKASFRYLRHMCKPISVSLRVSGSRITAVGVPFTTITRGFISASTSTAMRPFPLVGVTLSISGNLPDISTLFCAVS